MAGTSNVKKNMRRRGFMLQPRDLVLPGNSSLMRVADRELLRIAAGFGSTTLRIKHASALRSTVRDS